ncbi:hypothetical protein B0H13DRAFT_131555 [Mycena leptocephala]|nr:hypothetical protein B0H13DRAFT_131555 [Mycena leptocephala]
MNTHFLCDNPPEILSEILGFLDAKTLLLCCSVCTLLHEIVKSSPDLQYTIELWADGMVRGNSGVLTRAETLEVLYKRRRAWLKLRWTSQDVLKIESLATCRAYELVGSFFAQQQEGPYFLAISLSCIVNDRENAATACNPAFLYVPTGGLAYLELRTISSQRPHPRAVHPFLTFSLERDPEMALTIQIVTTLSACFSPTDRPCSI